MARARHELFEAKAPRTRSDVPELARRLKKHGFAETGSLNHEQAQTRTFSATFFFACLAAMELEGIGLEEI
jgi:hypothetical protein